MRTRETKPPQPRSRPQRGAHRFTLPGLAIVGWVAWLATSPPGVTAEAPLRNGYATVAALGSADAAARRGAATALLAAPDLS